MPQSGHAYPCLLRLRKYCTKGNHKENSCVQLWKDKVQLNWLDCEQSCLRWNKRKKESCAWFAIQIHLELELQLNNCFKNSWYSCSISKILLMIIRRYISCLEIPPWAAELQLECFSQLILLKILIISLLIACLSMLQQCLLHSHNNWPLPPLLSPHPTRPLLPFFFPPAALALFAYVFPGVVRQIATKCNYLAASTWA